MSRIGETFAALRRARQAALIPYLTVGDPDLGTSRELVLAAAAAGADLLELGVPFSDPMADGPVLQRSAERALAAGATLPRVLELVAGLRREMDTAVVLFGYYNPFLRYGLERLAADAATAGVDGILAVDCPPEEAGPLRAAADRQGLDLIALVAPTTPLGRVRRIAQVARGFLYFVSVAGVTGARSRLPEELPAMVQRARSVTPLPIGVGFGVSRPEHAAWIAGFADAVIVGSALAASGEQLEPHARVSAVGKLVRELAEATHGGRRLAAPAAPGR